MLKSTIVQAATTPKDQVQVRKINYRQTNARWVAMALGCMVLFGQQYCFDNPSALEHTIMQNLQHDKKKISIVTFNLLYILYSLPNVVICIFGGALIDKFKARTILVITIIILTAGQAVFTLGAYQNTFWIMLTGRIIFGVAAQTLTASQNTLISNWFKPSQLSLILGISISFPKLGSALNNFVSPMLAKKFEHSQHYQNVWVPLAVGLGLAFLSIAFAIVLFYMDFKSDKKEDLVYKQSVKASKNVAYIPEKKRQKKYISTSSIKVQQVENLLSETQENGQGGGHQGISLNDLKQLPLTFWLLLIVCMLSQALFIPFLDNGNSYFSTIYQIDSQRAGMYLILPYCICALITPIFGCVIDKIAQRAMVIVFSCLAFLITYGVMMTFQRIDANLGEGVIAIPLILLGTCCAVYCTAIVPSVPMLVERRLLGTAFGLMQMLQNLALGTFPLIAAAIRDSFAVAREGFQYQTMFYLGVSILCFIFSVALLIRDRMTDKKLYRKDFQAEYAKTILQSQFKTE